MPSLEPTFVEQQRQHLGSDFLMATQMCSRGVGGGARFVLPAVKTVAKGEGGSSSACCEPGKPILLGMGVWGPAMPPPLFNEGLALKKLCSVRVREVVSLSPEKQGMARSGVQKCHRGWAIMGHGLRHP